ncbi:MAG: hypothetical protein WCO12_01295 [bacterium]
MNFPSQIVTAEGAIGIIPVTDDEDSVSPSNGKTVSVTPKRDSVFKPVDVGAQTRRAYSGCFFRV